MKKNETQLMLDFEKCREAMKTAVDNFGKAATNLAAAHDNPETEALVTDEMKETRQTINRVVGILASQTGRTFHDVWVFAYHELNAKTGFHAVAASGGKGTHLDAVARAGRLPELKDTVIEMLTDEKYQPESK